MVVLFLFYRHFYYYWSVGPLVWAGSHINILVEMVDSDKSLMFHKLHNMLNSRLQTFCDV